MLRDIRLIACAVVSVLAACSGCAPVAPEPAPAVALPPYIANTVAEYAQLVGGDRTVQGYGVVVGLGRKGSSEVPAYVQGYLKDFLAKKNLGSYRAGTASLSPMRFLRDKDTTVVLVKAVIPPGAPVGSRIDVAVSSLPETQTKSLDGGLLMPGELRLAVSGVTARGGPSKVLAQAGGEVFLNPFLDYTTPSAAAQCRRGIIPGGGKVVVANPLVLQLRRPAHEIASVLQRRINGRFGYNPRVAIAKGSSYIELHIPSKFRDNYRYFLRLIMHLPINVGPGAEEAHARRIAEAMTLPNADHDELSLVWEAIGSQVVPTVKKLYASSNPPEAFYAARTGLRLGDRAALEVLLRFAVSSNSLMQIPAVEELGRHPGLFRSATTLRKLLDDDNELVRVAAYESLLKLGDRSSVRRTKVGRFVLDLVRSDRNDVVYATQTMQPRIVVFGKDMKVLCPMFYRAPDDLVTINAKAEDKTLTVWRKIPWDGSYSESQNVDFNVKSLITVLGSPPKRDDKGNVVGLRLTYGQVVSVLHKLCKDGDIKAKFVLQISPDIQRIYRGVAAAGRSDTPEP